MTTQTSGPDLIQTATAQTFSSLVLHGRGRMAVEFMSYGCGHCRALEPFVREAARSLSPLETIVRVNAAAEPSLASDYSIEATPTFVMFLDGREVGRAVGPHPTQAGVLAAMTRPFAS